MKDRFFNHLDTILESIDYPKTICVGISGGADSIALTHLLNQYCGEKKIKLLAITVNHNLREQGSDEANFVHNFCNGAGIYHEILNWEHGAIKSDVENQARNARYELLHNFCHKNNCKILMTAHHRDDNIETFLMNLSRGSGVYGLSGIKEIMEKGGITLVRPLLTFSKTEILNYCKDNNLRFVNDSMNEDEKFLRVKIRKNRHLLGEKLGITDDKILLAISNLSRIRGMIERQVESHLEHCEIQKNVFNLENFLKADDEIILRSLSKIIMTLSGEPFGPELEKLESLLSSLVIASVAWQSKNINKSLSKTLQGIKIVIKSNHLIFEKLK